MCPKLCKRRAGRAVYDGGPVFTVGLSCKRQREQLPGGQKRAGTDRQMLAKHLADKKERPLRVLPRSQPKQRIGGKAKARRIQFQRELEVIFKCKRCNHALNSPPYTARRKPAALVFS